jgi:hypothetical protein
MVTNHMIVPAAIIVMVGAFLFYLLEVRSVFLGDSSSLKRVGFLFGAATVLIARYGKTYGETGRQALYTGLLAIATIIAMSRYSTGVVNGVVNVLIVIAVWRFATGVTNNLDLEEAERKKEEYRLYGVERLNHEKIEREYGLKHEPYIDAPGLKREKETKKKKSSKKPWDAHGNPSTPVARLVVIAIIAFAVGEPIILSGPPEIGGRALVTVIVFLLASGIVLAAGSAIGTFRHTIISGGDASLSMVPIKITIGVILLVMILAAAITAPGIKYQGSGKLQPTQFKGKGNIQGKEDNRSKRPGDKGKQQKTSSEKSSERGRKEQQSQSSRQQGSSESASHSFFNLFTKLGKLLIIPLILIIAGFVIYALVKLWPNLKTVRFGFMDRLRNLLEKLKGLFRSKREKSKPAAQVKRDPQKILKTIRGLPPREAILTAYDCLLAFFERLGHQRLTRVTPYEFLYSLPERFSYLSGPTIKLTELYVSTAYSQNVPTPSDSQAALEALSKLKHLIEARKQRGKEVER